MEITKQIKKIAFVIILLIEIVKTNGIKVNAQEYEEGKQIVQTRAIYSYEEMCTDIKDLEDIYPEYIHSKKIGESVLGRDIDCIILGNENAPKKVMIQSTIHGREYVATQIAMRMVEYYCEEYSEGKRQETLNETCFYFLPMVNPDGVCIVQRGADSVADRRLKQFVSYIGNTKDWKCNARGVDLNRNFNVLWQVVEDYGKITPSYEMYKGYKPESEPEVIALKEFAMSEDFDAYINFHQMGNVIYYSQTRIDPEVEEKSMQLALTIQSVNDYVAISSNEDRKENESHGTFADLVQLSLKKPSATIEFGATLPPKGQPWCTVMFNENKDLLSAVSQLVASWK